MLARVTVGISYYNPGRFLRPAIQPVFAQSPQDWQLVLVNDCSSSVYRVGVGLLVGQRCDFE
jgi:glycosyltransferase involved in cell wall biosynthesis